MEKESQSQLLDAELLELDPKPCLWHPRGSELPVGGTCGDTEGTWAQGVGTVRGPIAGEKGMFPLPDQDSITDFALILQSAYHAEKDLKILQRWQKKTENWGWCSYCLMLLFGWGSRWALISWCNWDKWFLSVEPASRGEKYLTLILTQISCLSWLESVELNTLTFTASDFISNYCMMNWYMITFLYSSMANALLISHP